MKPMLKPSGTKRLKLTYGEPVSKIAFKFNLRRYSAAMPARAAAAAAAIRALPSPFAPGGAATAAAASELVAVDLEVRLDPKP